MRMRKVIKFTEYTYTAYTVEKYKSLLLQEFYAVTETCLFKRSGVIKEIFTLINLISIYSSSEEGFMRRRDRPEIFRSNILGRLPSINTQSKLVNYIKV